MITKNKFLPEGITRRLINEKVYICIDVGVDNFERARNNREMVANKDNITNYIIAEYVVRHLPRSQKLPSWVPQADVPTISKDDWHKNGGEDKGYNQVRFLYYNNERGAETLDNQP